ncbi:hypothetical protein [Neolewinella agarilytica]|uniref:SGNH/GDSL hydrolase family protein n=1 Tax=Neolewinella agarilytica TaxID=478744 RepID=A0A1H9DXW2_9BACT|nr:hypothetical protein [Neolewinella agarilytica]SEQ18329.1 hypothetical protein SAMN05444359_106175 [Neolewinella agarilytica]
MKLARLGNVYAAMSFIFKKKKFVFGDSHTEVFTFLNSKVRHKFYYDVSWVGGATAVGMRNPNSKTNSLKIFRDKIGNIKNKDSGLIFQLGEVDTGFVIWYRSQKYNEPVSKQLNQSVNAYFEFIDYVIDKGFKNITIVSAPLPTILDNQDWGEIANLRKEIIASQKERTDLTMSYNKQLSLNCKKRGISFINCDDFLLDKETNLIKNEFRNKDKNNHHLDIDKYSSLVEKLLLSNV